jgi:hypothetical protein
MSRALSSLYDFPYWRLVQVYHHISGHTRGNPHLQISHTFHLQLNKLRFGYWCFRNLKQNRAKSQKFCWEHATETSILNREKWIIDPLVGKYKYFSMSSEHQDLWPQQSQDLNVSMCRMKKTAWFNQWNRGFCYLIITSLLHAVSVLQTYCKLLKVQTKGF